MQRRNFLKAIAALVASPALLLKKRKREADRSADLLPLDKDFDFWTPIQVNYKSPAFPRDTWDAIKGIEETIEHRVGLSDVILYGKSKV